MRKQFILSLIALISFISFSACGGGAGSSSSPSGEPSGVPFSVNLIPSSTIAQINASIILRAKVLDGNGVPVVNKQVTFTNLSEPFGTIKNALRTLGIIGKKVSISPSVVNTDGNGIATAYISATSFGFATVQAEVNSGVGTIRDRKTVLFSNTGFPATTTTAPTLTLHVSDDGINFDRAEDFTLFKTPGDNQRVIMAEVLDESGNPVVNTTVSFGSDSTQATFPLGNTGTTNANGQAFATLQVDPNILSNTPTLINITASGTVNSQSVADVLTLFLEPVVVSPSLSSFTANPVNVQTGQTSTITAAVVLNTGNTVPNGTSVNFSTTCGFVTPFGQTSGGIATATFTAPTTVPAGGVCTVAGKVEGVTIGSADITVVAPLSVVPGTQSVSGVTGGPASYTISGGMAPYAVTTSDPTLPPSPLSVPASGGTFTVTVLPGTVARTVTYTVTDSLGTSVAATLTITGPTSLQILPPSVTIVGGTSPQTVTFAISGSPNTPYITTSSDPTKAFNDNGAGAHAGNGMLDADEGGIWISPTPFSTITVTIPANVAAGTVTLNVFDSIGGTTSATITIIGGGAAGPVALAVTPASVSVTGLHNPDGDNSDNLQFRITGGTGPFTVLSDNSAVIAGLGTLATGLRVFNIDPNSVAASTAVTLTVVDTFDGSTATASVTVTPATSSLAINPSSISVTKGTIVTFNIIGGLPNFRVYSSNTGLMTVGGNPLTTSSTSFPAAASATNTGSVTITVVDSDNKTVTANVTITAPPAIPTPDFSIACNPASVHVPTSGSNTTVCTVTSLNAFSAAVNLSCTGQPANLTCAFTPSSSPTPPAGLSTSAVLTITDNGTGAYPQTSNFFVLGTSGSLSHTTAMTVNVP
jgi:hypothetical protein